MLREVFERGKELADKVTNVVMNYTEVEAKVRSATNDDPWGPHGQDMQEIAEYTKHYDTMSQVMGMLWRRMFHEQKANWRRTYKSLLLLSYLLRNGSERIVASCKDHIYDLKLLESYQFIDENGKDQGVNIRHKANSLIALLENGAQLSSERNKAASNRSKYNGGISSSGGGGASLNGHYHGHGHGHRYRGSDDDNDGGEVTDTTDTGRRAGTVVNGNGNGTSTGAAAAVMKTRPKSPAALSGVSAAVSVVAPAASVTVASSKVSDGPVVDLLDLSSSCPSTAPLPAAFSGAPDTFDPFNLSETGIGMPAPALTSAPTRPGPLAPVTVSIATTTATMGPARPSGPSLPSSPTGPLGRQSDDFDGFVRGPDPVNGSVLHELDLIFGSAPSVAMAPVLPAPMSQGHQYGMQANIAQSAATSAPVADPSTGRGVSQHQSMVGATWTNVGCIDISLDSLSRARPGATAGGVTPSRSLNELQRRQQQQQHTSPRITSTVPVPAATPVPRNTGVPPSTDLSDLLLL